ncbi:MAG: mechanosensitive ion channel family protein [Deltaproteobacteria bacterium]|nr:MAG: mechanosensitive ion channel family protein [Deltaproteobacteria bacterium]
MHPALNVISQAVLGAAAPAATTAAAAPAAAETTWIENLAKTVTDKGVDIGLMVLGAIAVWVIGRWIINLIAKIATRAMRSRKFDETLERYLLASLRVVLDILLIVAVLSVFGVETTSFAALFAAAGVAIGLAWSGLLSNFAAGIFMIFLRPIKVGDFVTAGGVTGTVQEIGLFVTIINTMDNVRTIIGNNKIFSDTMQNFTANPFRRVDLVAQLDHTVDTAQAMELLRARLAQIPNTVNEPTVEILTFTLAGPVLCVRPYCHNDHYWDVYFATNAAIVEVCGKAGYPAPEQHFRIAQTPPRAA